MNALSSIRGVMLVWDCRMAHPVANQALHAGIAFKGCSHGLSGLLGSELRIMGLHSYEISWFFAIQAHPVLAGRLTRIDCNVGSRAGLRGS